MGSMLAHRMVILWVSLSLYFRRRKIQNVNDIQQLQYSAQNRDTVKFRLTWRSWRRWLGWWCGRLLCWRTCTRFRWFAGSFTFATFWRLITIAGKNVISIATARIECPTAPRFYRSSVPSASTVVFTTGFTLGQIATTCYFWISATSIEDRSTVFVAGVQTSAWSIADWSWENMEYNVLVCQKWVMLVRWWA